MEGGGRMQQGWNIGFGVLPAPAGLHTSISCQRYSKMVARAASSLYRKKGQCAEDGEEEGEAMQRRVRKEAGQNKQQTLLLLLLLLPLFFAPVCQVSFNDVVEMVEACTEKEGN